MSRLWTLTEAACTFRTERAVIRGLVVAHGLQTKVIPLNGNAKGLDASDMAILARALNQSPAEYQGKPSLRSRPNRKGPRRVPATG